MNNPILIAIAAIAVIGGFVWLGWPRRAHAGNGRHASRGMVSHARRRPSRADREAGYYDRYDRTAPPYRRYVQPAFETMPDIPVIVDDGTIVLTPCHVTNRPIGSILVVRDDPPNPDVLPVWVRSALGAESVDEALAAICSW